MKKIIQSKIKLCVPFILALSLVIVIDALFTGCAALDPGADPIVVRAEQTETGAKASFDLILNVDHLDRGFWRTNAPAFHRFCEWLRAPMPVWETNTLPRAGAMIISLNNVKNDYKAGRASSNALNTAIIVLRSAKDEATAWSAIVSNNPAR